MNGGGSATDVAGVTTSGRGTSGKANGFTLIELVIVVVIIGVVAAIAVPTLSSGSERARDAALRLDTKNMQSALDRYAADHAGYGPHQNSDGSPADEETLRRRLTSRTNEDGTLSDTGMYGGYLLSIPVNPRTACLSINIGAWADGADCSWRIDPDLARVRPDHAGAQLEDW